MAEEEIRQDSSEMSFWDHLEVLRGTLFRSVIAITLVSVVVFCFKKFVFDDVVLAPTRSDFWVYRLFNMDVKMNLVNLEISTQFFVHLKVAFELGFILAFPFVIWEIWKFIAPALYQNEKKTVSELRKTYPEYCIAKNRIDLEPTTDVDAILRKVKELYGQEKDVTVNDIDGVKLDFPDKWVHLRKSNTEPIIRVYSEASTEETADEIGKKIMEVVKSMS